MTGMQSNRLCVAVKISANLGMDYILMLPVANMIGLPVVFVSVMEVSVVLVILHVVGVPSNVCLYTDIQMGYVYDN